LSRPDSFYGQVSWAVPVTRLHPPPQAVIALQFAVPGAGGFVSNAQIVYVPEALDVHCANPAVLTVTSVVGVC
jgi:hypothetical protein